MIGSAQKCFMPSRDCPLGQESTAFPGSLRAARTGLLLAGTPEATPATLLTLEAMDLPPRTPHKLPVVSSYQVCSRDIADFGEPRKDVPCLMN